MPVNILARLRAARPLVHCITNPVSANDCANLLLAAGASPIMADDPDESAEITAMSDGLVLNMGMPSCARLKAMRLSGQAANRLRRPVVLDPVGVSCSQMRRKAAAELLESVRFAIIRGNASEIAALTHGPAQSCGVDAEDGISSADIEALAQTLAVQTGAVVAVTGETDVIADGKTVCRVRNGHPIMRCITGAGCQLSALMGACAAASPERPFAAALAAACMMGVCGEIAVGRLSPIDGSASCRNYMIDAMYNLNTKTLERRARYEI